MKQEAERFSPDELKAVEADNAAEAALFAYAGDDRVVISSDLRAKLAAEQKISHSFKTGIDGLDDAMKGLETGELIAIGGPTKNGKTLLAQTMTHNLALAGVHCLWFTFEVPARQFLEQIDPMADFYLPEKLHPGKIEWLKKRILEAKIKFDTRVVFIDNLHHLIDFTSVRNVSLDIGTVIRELKRTAVDLNVCILVLCHSKKPIDSSGYIQEVSEWDLRDSSFIPQECDSTVMVQRRRNPDTKMIENKAMIKVCLHRRSGKMGVKIDVVKAGNLLLEDPEPYRVVNGR